MPLSAATGAGAVVALPFSTSLPDMAAVLLAITSATAAGIMTFIRWLPPRREMFEHGYRVGWADRAATERLRPPPDDNVRPFRPVKS